MMVVKILTVYGLLFFLGSFNGGLLHVSEVLNGIIGYFNIINVYVREIVLYLYVQSKPNVIKTRKDFFSPLIHRNITLTNLT